ncbi:DNA cytosine methyltransferase [Mycoplasmopsis fermentans]
MRHYLVNNEAKRLQSFSDDFIFLVAKLVVTKQLGNSVQLMQ